MLSYIDVLKKKAKAEILKPGLANTAGADGKSQSVSENK
jgi:hypothetical protein